MERNKESIKDQLTAVVNKYRSKVDYIEARFRHSCGTSIVFRSRDIESVSEPESVGGNVRALYKNGWGFVYFNDLKDLERAAQKAVLQAKLAGTGRRFWKGREPVVEDVPEVKIGKDPRQVPLNRKVEILKGYSELVFEVSERISSSKAVYSDVFSEEVYVNSEGTILSKAYLGNYSTLITIAQRNDMIQHSWCRLIDSPDFNDILRKEDLVRRTAKRASDLLFAPSVKGGMYTVVLDGLMGGLFVHEAFGHLSEADLVYEQPELRKLMKLGRRFGPSILNIADYPAYDKKLRGYYLFDDEGVKGRKNYLVKDGILVGRLHNRETALKMRENLTGNARAGGYSSRPLVRMSCTYIEPGKTPVKDLFSGIKIGVYARSGISGFTDRDNFTFTAEWGQMIRDGEPAEMIRDVTLTGNVFETLKNVEAIGDDLEWEGGTCGKGDQWMPNSPGSPHLRIKEVMIGGK